MLQIPDNVRQALVTLIPAAIFNEISAFAFYDNHPCDEKKIEIIICTSRGELKEFYNRELVCSKLLDKCTSPSNILLYRNSNSELFYIISVGEELNVLSRKETLEVVQRVNNVDSYCLDDPSCSGQACLKVIKTDDAVPLYFDENFLSLENGFGIPYENVENLPLFTQLMTRFTEAKYSVKCNEVAYEELSNIRQIAAYSVYQENMPESDDVMFLEDNKSQESGCLKIKTQKPWVKMNNDKIVVVLDALNTNEVPLTDVHILLQCDTRISLIYTTRVYEKNLNSPFWCEIQKIEPKKETAIVAVVDIRELKYNLTSSVEFSGIIAYKIKDKEHILPFENVMITASDMMGEDLNILSNIGCKDSVQNNLLAILATTEKIDLCLRCIEELETELDILNTFVNYLRMERISGTHNVVIRKSSPCHVLNGVMMVLHDRQINSHAWTVSVYVGSPHQVVALIHYIYDVIPHRIVITTINQRLLAKTQLFSHYNEALPTHAPVLNNSDYASSVLKQTTAIINYFDTCMIEMNQSKNPVVQSKIGREIDLFAGGVEEFLKFRNLVLEECSKGVNSLLEKSTSEVCEGIVSID